MLKDFFIFFFKASKHTSENATAWSGRTMHLEEAAELGLLSGEIQSDAYDSLHSPVI